LKKEVIKENKKIYMEKSEKRVREDSHKTVVLVVPVWMASKDTF
jgi:hypothetical protein